MTSDFVIRVAETGDVPQVQAIAGIAVAIATLAVGVQP